VDLIEAFRLWRAARRIRRSIEEADMEKVKAGIKTSEFWLALIAANVAIFNQHLGLNLPTEAIVAVSGIAISYIVGRSWVKKA
jgi:hypothetical protein